MSFANQVAVITGASRGIGRALAAALARAGYRVGLVARQADLLAAAVDDIRRDGGTARAATADVAERDQVVKAVGALAAELGPVDLLVANAGLGLPTTLEPFNTAAMEQVFRVNTLGVLYAVEAVLPEMLRRGRGHLAAVSSLGSYKGLPGSEAYCASKAAVNIFMEGLRLHLDGRGIAVTTLCPGFVRTDMTAGQPFRPWLLEPDEAARRMVGALRRRVKVYNFPWTTTLLMKLAAWLPDRFVAGQVRRYQPPPMP